jgi:hypothetical protein
MLAKPTDQNSNYFTGGEDETTDASDGGEIMPLPRFSGPRCYVAETGPPNHLDERFQRAGQDAPALSSPWAETKGGLKERIHLKIKPSSPDLRPAALT